MDKKEIRDLSPKIDNDFITKKERTRSTLAVRNRLLSRMLTKYDKESMDIKKRSVEYEVYNATLLKPGLHFFDENIGEWSFRPPLANNAYNFRPCWDFIKDTIFSKEIKQTELSELCEKLEKPPYELPKNVFPIIMTVFYLYYRDVLFLYKEKTFLPIVSAGFLKLLQRRPDLFSVSYVEITGDRKMFVEEFAKTFGQKPDMISIVQELYQIFSSLPPVVHKLTQLSDPIVTKVRDCFLNAVSPEQFVFVDLPAVFGVQPIGGGADDYTGIISSLSSLLYTHMDMLKKEPLFLLEKQRNTLLKYCGFHQDTDGWYSLARQAKWLSTRVKNEILSPFFNCIQTDPQNNVEVVISSVAKCSFERWGDTELKKFNGLAQGIGELFQQASSNFKNIDPVFTKKEIERKEYLKYKLYSHVLGVFDFGDNYERGDNGLEIAAALHEIAYAVERTHYNDRKKERAHLGANKK